jgi:hypothetical protein
MKLAICGSRTIQLGEMTIANILNLSSFVDINEIVSGGCPTGIDLSAKWCAKEFELKYTEFPANWEEHGKAAGPIRNKQIAEYADALLLIWDGESKGSASMKREMLALKKPIYEVILNEYN